MRILIVKLSSLGDIIHTLPAITDISHHAQNTVVDWAIEESYVELPKWHSQVKRVIPVAIRRWSQKPWSKQTRLQWRQCQTQLNQYQYDCVIDAQGLLKSALLSKMISAPCYGYDYHSAREPLASLLYAKKFNISRSLHAIDRIRQLFSHVLAYKIKKDVTNYGIQGALQAPQEPPKPYIVAIHGSAHASKQWPTKHWKELINMLRLAGYQVKLPWGNDNEHQQAISITGSAHQTDVLPRMDLNQFAMVLANATGVVACDTGPAHLAAALGKSMVVLYGATNPKLIGTRGSGAHKHIKEACLESITPERVWKNLRSILIRH